MSPLARLSVDFELLVAGRCWSKRRCRVTCDRAARNKSFVLLATGIRGGLRSAKAYLSHACTGPQNALLATGFCRLACRLALFVAKPLCGRPAGRFFARGEADFRAALLSLP